MQYQFGNVVISNLITRVNKPWSDNQVWLILLNQLFLCKLKSFLHRTVLTVQTANQIMVMVIIIIILSIPYTDIIQFSSDTMSCNQRELRQHEEIGHHLDTKINSKKLRSNWYMREILKNFLRAYSVHVLTWLLNIQMKHCTLVYLPGVFSQWYYLTIKWLLKTTRWSPFHFPQNKFVLQCLMIFFFLTTH